MAFGREDVIVRFGGDASGLNREMGNLERGVSKLRSAFATIGTAIGVGALGRQLAEAATNIDKFRRGFEQIAGSSRSARAEMQYVSESANRMGIGLDTAREAYLSLTAAAKGTALEGEQARRIFEAVGGAMAKLGRSGDDARGALLAIEQMISKGTVSAEELRGQLGERLPGAFQAAARAMGVTTEELGKLLQTGQITAEEMLPKLAAELENLYGTASRAESLAASWTRFQNALQQVTETLAEGLTPAFQGALDWATKLTDKIDEFVKSSRAGLTDLMLAWRQYLALVNGNPELSAIFKDARRGLAADESQRTKGYWTGAGGRLTIGVPLSGYGGSGSADAARPGVDTSKLNPEFDANLQALIAEGTRQGFELGISSAYRSTAKQAELYAAALRKYGSAALARQNVAPPGSSLHEKGLAADITGSAAAQRWVAENASRFGLGTYTGPGYGGSHIHVQMIDQAKAAAAAQAELTAQTKRDDEARAEYTRTMEEGLAVQLSVMTAAEQHAAQVEKLNALYQAGAFGLKGTAGALETYRRAVAASAESLQDLKTKADDADSVAREIGLTFTSAFEDAVVAGNSLRDVLKGIAQDLLRLFVRKAVTEPFLELTKPFFSAIGSAIFGAPIKSALGNVMTSSGPMPLQRYSAGGIATSPQLALFGEGSGAEAYVPLPDGRRIPVAMKSPGVSVTVNNMPGQDARVRDDGRGGLTIDIVRAALADDARRGGVPWTRGLEAAYGLGRAR